MLEYQLRESLVVHALENSRTQSGESLATLSADYAVLIVFLRHAGCAFCRETLHDIARLQSVIEEDGTRIVLVHMGDVAGINLALKKYGLLQIERICDPPRTLYRAFGLKRGTFFQLFGWKVLWRTLWVGPIYGMAPAHADPGQLPGVFLIRESTIVRRFRHRSPADRPDYRELCAADPA